MSAKDLRSVDLRLCETGVQLMPGSPITLLIIQRIEETGAPSDASVADRTIVGGVL